MTALMRCAMLVLALSLLSLPATARRFEVGPFEGPSTTVATTIATTIPTTTESTSTITMTSTSTYPSSTDGRHPQSSSTATTSRLSTSTTSTTTIPAPTPITLDPARKRVEVLVSVASEKSLYKNGERVKIVGHVVGVGADLPRGTVIDLRIQRISDGNGEAFDWDTPDYRTLVEPKANDFSDDGFAVQLEQKRDSASFGFSNRTEHFQVAAYVVGGSIIPVVSTFAVTEFGSGIAILLVVSLLAIVVSILVLVYSLLISEPTKDNARNTLFAIYVGVITVLALVLGGPVLLTLFPSLEALVRTTPIGLMKCHVGATTPVEWVVNIGGVADGDNGLTGGFVMPMFVLVLSMIGGMLALLLQLPSFLKTYSTLDNTNPKQEDLTKLQSEMLLHFIYAVAAPFLGIVLFSFAVLADYKNPYALAVLALSVGFVSEQIVGAMIKLTGKVLGGDPKV